MTEQRLFSLIVVVACIVMSSPVISGCNRHARYRTASFFFDGVPNPDEPPRKTAAEDGGQSGITVPAPIYKHPAAGENNECSLCHGAGMPSKFTIPPPDICLNCHSKIKEDRAFIHAPAALDCLVCHDIHQSTEKSLVRKTGNLLCLGCHYREPTKEARETAAHRDVPEDKFYCLSCHDPHGGDTKDYIRKDLPATNEEIKKPGDGSQAELPPPVERPAEAVIQKDGTKKPAAGIPEPGVAPQQQETGPPQPAPLPQINSTTEPGAGAADTPAAPGGSPDSSSAGQTGGTRK